MCFSDYFPSAVGGITDMGLMDTEATGAGCFHHHRDTGPHVKIPSKQRRDTHTASQLHHTGRGL